MTVLHVPVPFHVTRTRECHPSKSSSPRKGHHGSVFAVLRCAVSLGAWPTSTSAGARNEVLTRLVPRACESFSLMFERGLCARAREMWLCFWPIRRSFWILHTCTITHSSHHYVVRSEERRLWHSCEYQILLVVCECKDESHLFLISRLTSKHLIVLFGFLPCRRRKRMHDGIKKNWKSVPRRDPSERRNF